MKCLYIGIVLLMYNYMMISGQVLSDDEETSYIGNDNGTNNGMHTMSPMSSYEKHRCPENMELYPVEEGINVWICDCKPGFLYFPLSDSCYEAYRQGPCPFKNYFVFPENETTPRCVENPCLQDGMVPYNGACYPLKRKLPSFINPCIYRKRLEVDETTFQLICVGIANHDSIGNFRPQEIVHWVVVEV